MESTHDSVTLLRRKLGIVTGAAMAVSLLVVAYSTGPRRLEPAHFGKQSGLASSASAHGLISWSPASLAPAPNQSASVDQSDIAAWASAKGLTGLSPASLAPAPNRSASVDLSTLNRSPNVGHQPK